MLPAALLLVPVTMLSLWEAERIPTIFQLFHRLVPTICWPAPNWLASNKSSLQDISGRPD